MFVRPLVGLRQWAGLRSTCGLGPPGKVAALSRATSTSSTVGLKGRLRKPDRVKRGIIEGLRFTHVFKDPWQQLEKAAELGNPNKKKACFRLPAV